MADVTVQIPGLSPLVFTPSITGQVISGQALVGGTFIAGDTPQFGDIQIQPASYPKRPLLVLSARAVGAYEIESPGVGRPYIQLVARTTKLVASSSLATGRPYLLLVSRRSAARLSVLEPAQPLREILIPATIDMFDLVAAAVTEEDLLVPTTPRIV